MALMLRAKGGPSRPATARYGASTGLGSGLLEGAPGNRDTREEMTLGKTKCRLCGWKGTARRLAAHVAQRHAAAPLPGGGGSSGSTSSTST